MLLAQWEEVEAAKWTSISTSFKRSLLVNRVRVMTSLDAIATPESSRYCSRSVTASWEVCAGLQLYLGFVASVKRFLRRGAASFHVAAKFYGRPLPPGTFLAALNSPSLFWFRGRACVRASICALPPRHHIKFGVKYKRKCRLWCARNERNRRPHQTHGPRSCSFFEVVFLLLLEGTFS